MKYFNKILWGLVFALPAVLFFSYYPIIRLGNNSSMNFELSVPLIWLVVFDLLAFATMILRWSQMHKGSNPAAKEQLRNTKRGINFPGISDRKIFLLSLFPFFATLSIFWSMNPVRAILTAGIIWLLFFAVFALIFVLPLLEQPKNFRAKMIKAILIPSLAVCGFCWLQCFLDVWGVGREQSLLCRGCVSDMFGFPHPSGFAIEPQFMGNLLLAPTLLALYLVAFPQPKSVSKVFAWASAAICSATLFITFSRGAIYAYFVALAIMLIFAIAQHKSRPTLAHPKVTGAPHTATSTHTQKSQATSSRTPSTHADAGCGPRFAPIIGLPAATFLFALAMQGTFAMLGPTSTTFTEAITKSIHHLSLGIVDLRPKASQSPKESQSPKASSSSKPSSNSENDPNQSQESQNSPAGSPEASEGHSTSAPSDDQAQAVSSATEALETQNQPIFDGYVAESTNVRLGLNEIALKTWLSAPGHPGTFWIGYNCHTTGEPCNDSIKLTPTSILFGVGLGGAGTAMHAAFPDQIASPKEIVQNQTFSLLLELGLVGVFLIHLALVIAFLAPLLPWWFVDGRSGKKRPRNQYKNQGIVRRTISKLQENEFWSSPALPLLLSLVVAYGITLNFFSGLPNALHIYLMPPLILVIYCRNSTKNS